MGSAPSAGLVLLLLSAGTFTASGGNPVCSLASACPQPLALRPSYAIIPTSPPHRFRASPSFSPNTMSCRYEGQGDVFAHQKSSTYIATRALLQHTSKWILFGSLLITICSFVVETPARLTPFGRLPFLTYFCNLTHPLLTIQCAASRCRSHAALPYKE